MDSQLLLKKLARWFPTKLKHFLTNPVNNIESRCHSKNSVFSYYLNQPFP